MLKIGEFSKLSRVSVRMLRHYDEIGLLKPAEIDRLTEYRYYREDQLPVVCRITALKDMGFALADIVRILAVYEDREALVHLQPADPCLCAVTFLDGEFKETDVEMEAWKTVRGQYHDTEHVKFRTLPEVTVASCIFKGPYTCINEVIAAVASWIQSNGYEFNGPMFNIYHVSPKETKNPEEFVTEVCYPVRKR